MVASVPRIPRTPLSQDEQPPRGRDILPHDLRPADDPEPQRAMASALFPVHRHHAVLM